MKSTWLTAWHRVSIQWVVAIIIIGICLSTEQLFGDCQMNLMGVCSLTVLALLHTPLNKDFFLVA